MHFLVKRVGVLLKKLKLYFFKAGAGKKGTGSATLLLSQYELRYLLRCTHLVVW